MSTSLGNYLALVSLVRMFPSTALILHNMENKWKLVASTNSNIIQIKVIQLYELVMYHINFDESDFKSLQGFGIFSQHLIGLI